MLTPWAAVVAEVLGFERDEVLTLGRVEWLFLGRFPGLFKPFIMGDYGPQYNLICRLFSEATGKRESLDQEGQMADEIKLEVWVDYI